ncbi:hypothetical protein GQ55_2G050000 [Panicum hallii var. hallii]|uniref:Uncharacterized protein n=1 Tax=Panicum hallii var. hallii TaxID=1504633 RepID=A0A2T7ELI2_9POAL|nr:hypothetical protein GQ55_2G050000 [Panicum hallii var. hallii]
MPGSCSQMTARTTTTAPRGHPQLRRRAGPRRCRGAPRTGLHLLHQLRRAPRRGHHGPVLRDAEPEDLRGRRRWAQGRHGPTCLGHAVP